MENINILIVHERTQINRAYSTNTHLYGIASIHFCKTANKKNSTSNDSKTQKKIILTNTIAK